MKELSEKEALQKAAGYCSQSEHCVSEVQSKLAGWGVSVEASERIIDYLQKERYIDEERYCRSFVSDKLKYNKWGRLKIMQGLRMKSIPSNLCAEALDAIDPEVYLSVLTSILQAKRPGIKARNEYELNGKLMRFALGRGFEMDVVRDCLRLADDEDT